MIDDGQALWNQLLAELEAQADAVTRLAATSAPPLRQLDEVAGGLFDLRTSCALLGLEPGAVLASYGETLLRQLAAGRAYGEVQPALVELGEQLHRSWQSLRTPDPSGARLDHLDALRAVIERLAKLTGAEPVDAAPATSEPAAAPLAGDDDSVWTPQVDEDMIDPFLEEATERIEALSQKLLRLESAPHDGELVREIFRDLHTVKGSSGFVGLKRMNRLAHAAEELVGQLRDGRRSVDRGVVDALLFALDGLRALLQAASRGVPGSRAAGTRIDVPIDEALRRLASPTETRLTAAAAGTPGAAEALASAGAGRAATGERAAADATKQTLRVDFDKLDALLNLVGELVLSKARLHESAASLTALQRELESQLRLVRYGKAPLHSVLDDLDRFQRIYAELTGDLSDGAGELDHVAGDLRQQVMKLRMLPIGRVFNKYQRTVRELSHTLGKRARLEIVGAETELDKVLLEQLDDPLLHLVRNAVDHGIEPPELRRQAGKNEEGVLTLAARHRGNQIVVEVSDDGAGLHPDKLRKKAIEKSLATAEELAQMDDKQVLDVIFRPGFSTAARVTDVSGRGVGMDVVRETIHRLSGSIEISSEPGRGTTFTLKLPLTLAILQVLLVRVGGEELALPLDAVERTLAVPLEEVHRVLDRELLILGSGDEQRQVPLVWLADALELERALPTESEVAVVLVSAAGEPWALAVDRLGEKREVVLKTLGELLEQVPCAAGATLVGDKVALVVDPQQVVQRALQRATRPPRASISGAPGVPAEGAVSLAPARRPRVLLAEDSDVIREALKRVLEAHGCEVLAARDGGEALELAERSSHPFDLVSTDVMMPVLDGYELTRRLRAHPRHKDVPIVMVTSRSEHIDRVRGFDAGVDEYLVKPLDSGELVRALERHVRRPA